MRIVSLFQVALIPVASTIMTSFAPIQANAQQCGSNDSCTYSGGWHCLDSYAVKGICVATEDWCSIEICEEPTGLRPDGSARVAIQEVPAGSEGTGKVRPDTAESRSVSRLCNGIVVTQEYRPEERLMRRKATRVIRV